MAGLKNGRSYSFFGQQMTVSHAKKQIEGKRAELKRLETAASCGINLDYQAIVELKASCENLGKQIAAAEKKIKERGGS